MDFFAIDVETANSRRASICQIGLVEFRDGEVAKEQVWFVDPEEEFGGRQIGVHGIRPSDVAGSPTFKRVLSEFHEALHGAFLVCHSDFDRASLRSASAKYGVQFPGVKWLDTLPIARQVWPELSSYDLHTVATSLGIRFRHHHAGEDARACGLILTHAISRSCTPLSDWIDRQEEVARERSQRRSDRDSNGRFPAAVTRNGNPAGPYAGQAVVFTGTLSDSSMSRGEAADLAAMIGFDVKSAVSKKVRYLVVGEHDLSQLAGHHNSSKMRKAQELQAEGHTIDLISESDFLAILHDATSGPDAST